jgi:hypothetical protein
MMAWQVSGNTKTDLSNAPQFTSVLAVKRFATSMGVLGLTSSGTLQVANIDDALTSFTTPITLNLVQKFGTGSYIPTTTVTGGTDAGIVPSIFFAGNLDPGLYAGATAAQTGVNIATGASSADMNVVNVLDSAGASFYVFTAGSAGTPAITPNKWMLTPDTVPVSAGAQAVKKALVGPTDKAAQLLGIGGLGSGNGFGVAYGEAASGASLTIRADIVSSLGSTFTAAGAPGVVQLSSTELPTGKGFEARWESTKQLVLAGPSPDPLVLGLNLLWYDAGNKVVRANLTGANRLVKTGNVVAASATVSSAGVLFIAWVETGTSGKNVVNMQTATCK